jgi:hypothetical protein
LETELACEGGAPTKNANGVFNEGPLPAPWQTTFDDGFCSYNALAGFCYADADSSYRLVSSPVHSAPFAAAFDLTTTTEGATGQARCVREGALPEEAYYSAWYYVPSDLTAARDWNLFHFQGGLPGERLHGLWDVSMDATPDGELVAYVLDGVRVERHEQATPQPIPRDRWFQLEFYLKRATDATGAFALHQDGVELVQGVGLITDDTQFGQWYVGNFAGSLALTPPTSTLYVDDVAVRLP